MFFVETLGVWPEGRLQQERHCEAAATAAKYLIQQLSIKFWMYNAKLLLSYLACLTTNSWA